MKKGRLMIYLAGAVICTVTAIGGGPAICTMTATGGVTDSLGKEAPKIPLVSEAARKKQPKAREEILVAAEAPEGSLSGRVIYPVAVIRHSAHRDKAESFVDFLKTKEALEVFEDYGFSLGEIPEEGGAG